MKIAEINTVRRGSTGKIMLQIAETARNYGHEAYTFSRAWYTEHFLEKFQGAVGFTVDNIMHRMFAPLLGKEGVLSYFGTKRFIVKLKKIDPDVIHLHNLHGYYINLPLLFKYIKKNKKKVIWTLHDCWSFTGHCPHFAFVQCEKWKTGCDRCPQQYVYPKMYVDSSKWMYKKKKQWFTGIEDMTIVTPSVWLADLVKQSFLKDYPVCVINNGINLEIFKPTQSDFRKRHNISEDKKILLGVAFGWGAHKGLDVFLELANRLDPEKYQIVLVGTNEEIDLQIPPNIISIHRTNNQAELAQIYTAADLFVNPTKEDTYPTVNMESLACGTPVLTFRTGGSPEILDESCGAVVDCGDVDAMEKEIVRICENNLLSKKSCIERAKTFDKNKRFEEYIKLYEDRAYRT